MKADDPKADVGCGCDVEEEAVPNALCPNAPAAGGGAAAPNGEAAGFELLAAAAPNGEAAPKADGA